MNRNAVVDNGTVFGTWTLGRSIAVVGALLVMTFVVIEPEASRGLGVAARTVFWAIHVGLGLVSLYAASWLVLPHMMKSLPPWLVLLVAGTGGALLVTPLSYLVETIHTCQDTASSSSTDTATRYGSDRGHLGGAGGHLEQYGRRDGRPGREGSPIIATSLLLRRRELCHRQDPQET